VGTIELAIPKLRQGSYLPSFLNARKRSEQALLGVVMEACTNGVSTRKVERLVEQLGVESMSKSQVSRICQALACRDLSQSAVGGRLHIPVAGRADRARPQLWNSRWNTPDGTVPESLWEGV